MNTYYNKSKNNRRKCVKALAPLWLLVCLVAVAACSSIDCPMDNLVYTQYQLLKPDGSADEMADSLTITTHRNDGNDSVLINRDIKIKDFILPISYAQPTDSFFFHMQDTVTKQIYIDTVTVSKKDMIHFESTDCATSYFHTLTDVKCTTHRIDSVKIINHDVNYDTSKKHFSIYFHPHN